jgi:uncharacterized membrane protein (DUF2068 family)
MFIAVIVVYALLAFYESVPLFKQKLWRDFWTHAIFWIISFAAAILLCFDVKLPSPAKPIRDLVVSIFGKQG